MRIITFITETLPEDTNRAQVFTVTREFLDGFDLASLIKQVEIGEDETIVDFCQLLLK